MTDGEQKVIADLHKVIEGEKEAEEILKKAELEKFQNACLDASVYPPNNLPDLSERAQEKNLYKKKAKIAKSSKEGPKDWYGKWDEKTHG